MSQTTIEKIRSARALRVTVKHMTFIGRRPTVAAFGQNMQDATPDHDAARAAITGWSGVRECDIVKDGDATEIAFDQALWDEWIVDRPDIWRPITIAISDAVVAEVTRARDSEKNLPAG